VAAARLQQAGQVALRVQAAVPAGYVGQLDLLMLLPYML
jgi:hypothetical protein